MKFLMIFLALCLCIPIAAWTFMLTVGVVHSEWLPMLPTIGYGPSLVLMTVCTGFAVIRHVVITVMEALDD